MTLATLYLWNPLTSWELRTLTRAVTFNLSLWIGRESQLSNRGACQTQKEQWQSVKQVRNQLPRFLLQKISLCFKGDTRRVNADDGARTLALAKEPCQAPLAITEVWMKGNSLPAKYSLCGNFHKLGVLSSILGCWDELMPVVCPSHRQEMRQQTRPTWEAHVQKVHSRAKIIPVIICKGHLVHVKLNWYDLHRFKYARHWNILWETCFGKYHYGCMFQNSVGV